MRKHHSKLRKVLPLILGLAVGATANVSAENTVNNPVFNRPTGDFIFVTDYMHKTNRNENTNINELVKGGNITRVYALDPSEAIRSRIKFLDSARAKQFYSQEQRLDLIGRYENFLNELSRQKIAPSKKSLEKLSAAVSDGIINPEELKDVEDNVYAIIKEGIDKQVGTYSVFYLTTLTSETTSEQYQAGIKRLENAYNELQVLSEIQKEKAAELATAEIKATTKLTAKTPVEVVPAQGLPVEVADSIPGAAGKSAIGIGEVTKASDEHGQIELPLPKVSEKTHEKEKEDYTDISLLTQANSNFALNTFGGALGLRFAPFKDKNIGLGALVDFNFSLDKVIDSYTSALSAGRSAYGAVNETNANSIGLLLELQYGPLFAGGGVNYQNWITNTLEQILDASGNVVKSNTNSTPNRQVFGKGYLGVEFQPIDRWKLGAVVGYDGRKGIYAGVRNTFRLNSNKKKK